VLKSVRAIIDETGAVRILEPFKVDRPMMAILTVLDDEEETDGTGPSETAILSEAALQDWNRPEEDEAWAHLQQDR
jgi:hypothetical protein